jgi:hypothetical protein
LKWKITMNDEFMHQLYEAPRAEFAEALYERISQQPSFPRSMMPKLTFRNAVIAFVLLSFIAACVYVATENRWIKIGSIWVHVARTHKVEFIPRPEVSEEPVLPYSEPECVTVEEGREILRFDIKVPTWAPEGLHLDDRMCGIDRISDFVSLYWAGVDQFSGINLWISNQRGYSAATQKYETWEAAVWQPVAPGSYKEVQVHGQPAVLVQGDWDTSPLSGIVYELPPGREVDENGLVETKWDKKRGIQLHWLDRDVMYSLYAGTNVSAEDLIKMAESAQ